MWPMQVHRLPDLSRTCSWLMLCCCHRDILDEFWIGDCVFILHGVPQIMQPVLVGVSKAVTQPGQSTAKILGLSRQLGNSSTQCWQIQERAGPRLHGATGPPCSAGRRPLFTTWQKAPFEANEVEAWCPPHMPRRQGVSPRTILAFCLGPSAHTCITYLAFWARSDEKHIQYLIGYQLLDFKSPFILKSIVIKKNVTF